MISDRNLHDPVRATAGAGGLGFDHHMLSQQMLGEGLAPREGANTAGLVLPGRHRILNGGRFKFLKL